ncbi:hypothetical protein QWE_11426 [Agrobacterium albertimagni AOL15]|uniref:Uncharacterized protein n=1 Tax=Agrobacterium albertimagni AOL15 TaxID=1156935 RepID=K2QEG9_9HYPH|nr:hypothetical protein [Agrobacterium albertimagni]EKF59406.1 hypothetical protein QWE_11426 [Agrobacterium albertimagni AOL15]
MTWISEDDFRNQLRTLEAPDFYQSVMFSNQAYVFSRDHDEASASKMYDRFKEQIASHFEVSRHNVCLIGSGKTGYSLNPDKHFKLYNTESDIDVVIVSPSQFHSLWNVYVRLHYFDTEFKISDVRRDIFRQFVSFKQLPQTSQEIVDLEKRLGPLRRDLEKKFYLVSEINFRIYHNWEAVELYHIHGIQKIKSGLERGVIA